ncbi:hypothetical protein BDR26DRAFT_903903, partial [Obelidium mucronatum]
MCYTRKQDEVESDLIQSQVAPNLRTPQKSTPLSFLSARKATSSSTTPRVKPPAPSLTPPELQTQSILTCLHQMAFGTPQGAITKDAIQYFASNEADLPVYSTLSKLSDV